MKCILDNQQKGGVESFNGRKGEVAPQTGDYTAEQVGALASDGTAVAATKLATSRTIITDLRSSYSSSFDGTANITPGVTGVLPIEHGGTGVDNVEDLAKFIKTIPEIGSIWGDETADGDATWWANLKKWIGTATIDELSYCVGRTKSVTLSTTVLGTTTHLVRCIGYNCNRDINNTTRNTLTFETANCLAYRTTFGKWTGSVIRTHYCVNYYNAFPGKSSICTVSVGTCATTHNNQNGTPTYTDETVFLASDAEHGFPKGHDGKYSKGYSASYNEFDKYNTSKTPYQYCASNGSRIKKSGDNGTVAHYWERSLSYDDEGSACCVTYEGKPGNFIYSVGISVAPAFVI